MMLRGFRSTVRGYFRRHFRAVSLQILAGQRQWLAHTDAPLVVYANHSSWWDPMVSVLLAERLLPQRKHYAPMDAAALARYPVLKKIGIFPVEMQTARGAAQFLRTSLAVLTGGGVVWITPQGPVRRCAGAAGVQAWAGCSGRARPRSDTAAAGDRVHILGRALARGAAALRRRDHSAGGHERGGCDGACGAGASEDDERVEGCRDGARSERIRDAARRRTRDRRVLWAGTKAANSALSRARGTGPHATRGERRRGRRARITSRWQWRLRFRRCL